MARGSKPGERRGGRKKGTLNKSTQVLREQIEAAISTEERLRILAELARGIVVQDGEQNSANKVFSKPPDVKALEMLFSYQYGRPAQALDVSTKLSFEDWAKKLGPDDIPV
jgi:hypothetical protein